MSDAFDKYAAHFLKDVYGNLRDSSLFVSLCPDKDGLDVKFCTELGAAIMLDKPIIAFAPEGRECPVGLLRIAHAVVHSQEELQQTLKRMLAEKHPLNDGGSL